MQINIGFSIDDNYCQHCGALIASILKNASEQDTYKFLLFTNTLAMKIKLNSKN